MEDVKLNVCPEHKGVLAPAVGVAGAGFTVTAMVPVPPGQPAAVANTE